MSSLYDLGALHNELKRDQATREAKALHPLPLPGSPYDLGHVGQITAACRARREYVEKKLRERPGRP